MRHYALLNSGITQLLAAIVVGVVVGKGWLQAADKGDALDVKKIPPKAEAKIAPKPAESTEAKPFVKPSETKLTENGAASQPASDDRSEDEKAIIAMGVAYVKAFGDADAAAIGAMYCPDAEYIDEHLTSFRGRDEIERVLNAGFVLNPGATIELKIDSIRFVGPATVFEDGTTILIPKGEDVVPIYSQYSAVHVKTDGKWLTASVRERAPKDRRNHKAQLKNLAFLQGDWVDESGESVVKFSCAPIDGGNYLVRTYTIHLAGQESIGGTQRIGWDPLNGKLKSWIFDSAGGFSEGFWHRDGNRWVLRSSGVTADGKPASSTTVYTVVNDHTMTWQSVDHEIAGVELPDGKPVTIVRRPPAPGLASNK